MAMKERRIKRQKKRIERKVNRRLTDRQIKKAGLKPREGVSKDLAKKGFSNRSDKLKDGIVRSQRRAKLEAKKKIKKAPAKKAPAKKKPHPAMQASKKKNRNYG
jgi:hypothetical protein